jgi:structure-specific recognition protein 1
MRASDLSDGMGVRLNFSRDELRERYDGKLKKEYSDQTYVIMANLFETLVGKEMIPAGKFSR